MDDLSKSHYFLFNPSNPVPEKSASQYLSIPYDPQFEAWYEGDYKNTGYTTPGLLYQGPKNSTNIGVPRTDGDYLAKVHDLRYAHAAYLYAHERINKEQFHSKITYADDTFVEQNSRITPVGLIGRIGINVKQFAEFVYSSFGGEKHIYPGTSTVEDFDTNQQQFDFEPLKENMSRRDFFKKTSHFNDYELYASYYDSEQNRATLQSGYPEVYDLFKQYDDAQAKPSTSTSSKHPWGLKKDGTNKTYVQWKQGVSMQQGRVSKLKGESAGQDYYNEQHKKAHDSNPTLYNTYHPTTRLNSNKRPASNINADSISTNVVEDSNSENNSNNEEQVEQVEEMTRPQDDSMEGKQKTSASAGDGGGSGISTAVDQIYISGGFTQMGNKITFKNSFRMRSFGNSLFIQQGNVTANAISPNSIVYPYVSLPVEYAFFYLPEGLFNAIAALPQARPTGITCKVTPIGQMVSFGVNTEATAVGTTAHTLYGSAVVGLSKYLPCDKVTITRSTTKPMEVSAASKWTSGSVWIERLWGQTIPSGTSPTTVAVLDSIANSASNHEIIFPNTYLRVFFPSALRTGNQVPTDAAAANSYWNTNIYIPKFPMQPKTGTPVINFSYANSWPIMAQTSAPTLVTNGPASLGIVVARRGKRGTQRQAAPASANVQTGLITTNSTDATGTTLNQMTYNAATYGEYNFNNVPSYDAMANEHRQFGPCVPSVHVGIEAVRSNVPEANTTDYINASCDFYVETSISFEFNAAHNFNFSGFNVLMEGNHLNSEIGAVTSDNINATNTIYRRNQPLYI